jgi:hypothetical protein
MGARRKVVVSAKRESKGGPRPGGALVSVKSIGVALGAVFSITLAIVVGKEISTEAMAVMVGFVCGIAAGIPTSVLLLVALYRRDRHRSDEEESQARQNAYPPVIVIQGGGQSGLPPGPHEGYWPISNPGPSVSRQFQVLGGDDLLLDERPY